MRCYVVMSHYIILYHVKAYTIISYIEVKLHYTMSHDVILLYKYSIVNFNNIHSNCDNQIMTVSNLICGDSRANPFQGCGRPLNAIVFI